MTTSPTKTRKKRCRHFTFGFPNYIEYSCACCGAFGIMDPSTRKITWTAPKGGKK